MSVNMSQNIFQRKPALVRSDELPCKCRFLKILELIVNPNPYLKDKGHAFPIRLSCPKI
jgi:hypothetical protein